MTDAEEKLARLENLIGSGVLYCESERLVVQWALETIRSQAAEIERLRCARRNQLGDDLCWIVSEGEAKALPEAEFLESCRRHRAQIVAERGEFSGGMTIAQLEAEIERLRVTGGPMEALDKALGTIRELQPALRKIADFATEPSIKVFCLHMFSDVPVYLRMAEIAREALGRCKV